MDKTAMAVNVFNDAAETYQQKFMDVSLYHDVLDVFCNSISKHDAEVLDIACGPGNITRYLLSQRPGFKILGTDLAPNMLQLARANNPGAEFELMDCRDIGNINRKYDAIVCGFCLPYLSKEEATKLISDAAGILQPNGVVYLSTMEDDYSKSGMQTSSSGRQLYMYYHEAGYLMNALEENGFKIIDLQRKEYNTTTDTKVTDLIIIAGK